MAMGCQERGGWSGLYREIVIVENCMHDEQLHIEPGGHSVRANSRSRGKDTLNTGVTVWFVYLFRLWVVKS